VFFFYKDASRKENYLDIEGEFVLVAKMDHARFSPYPPYTNCVNEMAIVAKEPADVTDPAAASATLLLPPDYSPYAKEGPEAWGT
jgi:hypothetical protein